MGLDMVQNRVQNGLRMASDMTLQTGPQMVLRYPHMTLRTSDTPSQSYGRLEMTLFNSLLTVGEL